MVPPLLGLLLLQLLAAVVDCAQYLGCYRDPSVNARLLSDLKTNFKSTLTIERCLEHCQEKGFRYAGVEWKFECFCSNDRPSYKLQAEEGECNLRCEGDEEQICGGNLRINVYDVTDVSEDTNGVSNQSLGCFRDSAEDRHLKGPINDSDFTTPEYCVGFCYKRGYRLAAVQQSVCVCGDLLKKNLKVDKSECTLPCPGDEQAKCGGEGKSSLYHTGIPDNPLNEDAFLGCFRENGNENRLLSGMRVVLKQTNTPRRCMNICLASGYKFSGTQYSNECFCGNRKPPAEKEAEENQCQMPCAGNKKEFCGGVWRILVYPTGHGSVAPTFPELARQPATKRPAAGAGGQATKRPPTQGPPTKKPPTKRPAATAAPEALEAGERQPPKKCEKSVTTVNGGKPTCKGQLLFTEDFRGDKLNQQKWAHRIVMPWTPDYDFVVFDEKPANSYLKNGKLVIKPTLLKNEFVRSGKIELQNCTGEQYSGECVRQAATFNILPPIESARVYTKEFFAFKYGIVQIRAKLPVGDWIVPELWLEPKRRVYGLAYASGRVRIAMARGNRRLTIDDEDIGNDHLESGILMGVGMDEGIRGRTVIRSKPGGWHTQFYNFTLIWSPTNLRFLVDGEELSLIPEEGGTLCNLVGFTEEECATWKGGSPIAPFDNELYISIGLTVGGMRDFPDESMSGTHKKPWTNLNVKAMANFWQARDNWKSSWDEENSVLQVDNIKVYAL